MKSLSFLICLFFLGCSSVVVAPKVNSGIYSSEFKKAYFKNHELTDSQIDRYIVISPLEYEFLLKYIVDLEYRCEAFK